MSDETVKTYRDYDQGKVRTIQEYVDDIWKLDKIEVNTEGC